jgi:hypothetical protein
MLGKARHVLNDHIAKPIQKDLPAYIHGLFVCLVNNLVDTVHNLTSFHCYYTEVIEKVNLLLPIRPVQAAKCASLIYALAYNLRVIILAARPKSARNCQNRTKLDREIYSDLPNFRELLKNVLTDLAQVC